MQEHRRLGHSRGSQVFGTAGEHDLHTVSYDEKPGIQAISVTSPDLRPTESKGTIRRDYEYKRLGTLSLLAAIDLLTGEAIPLVRDTHSSTDFIDFLKILDNKYPQGDVIRIVLDNHSVHTCQKVKDFWQQCLEGLSLYSHRSMVHGLT